MGRSVLTRLLIANLLAIAVGLAGHCGDLHVPSVNSEFNQSGNESHEDCDHCFFCTGAGEPAAIPADTVRLPLAQATMTSTVVRIPDFDRSLDLPPKL